MHFQRGAASRQWGGKGWGVARREEVEEREGVEAD
jgi:hypothetical protein